MTAPLDLDALKAKEPAPFYDPSLHVPAVIVAAANMVSTWAAKQNRGNAAHYHDYRSRSNRY